MSTEITTALVDQYRSNVMMLLQQKESRFRAAVRTESMLKNKDFFEQIGVTDVRQRTTRHGDTPLMNTPHARRMITTADYDWADLIDDVDRLRILIDPTGPYTMAAVAAFNRKIDDVIIEAFDGTAYTGATGTTQTPYDTSNTVDVQVGGSSSDVGLNVEKLRAAKEILDANEVEDEDRFIAVNAKQMRNLLAETEVTSSDFNTVRSLVNGELNTFLGFTFIRSQRLGVDANSDHKVPFWNRQGMLFGILDDIKAKVDPRPDKNYSTQVFVSASFGATRMEEGRVGYIECDPS